MLPPKAMQVSLLWDAIWDYVDVQRLHRAGPTSGTQSVPQRAGPEGKSSLLVVAGRRAGPDDAGTGELAG